MNTLRMNNGAVVMADRHARPLLLSRQDAILNAAEAGPDWTIEVMRTCPRYYVVLAASRPNIAINRDNPK